MTLFNKIIAFAFLPLFFSTSCQTPAEKRIASSAPQAMLVTDPSYNTSCTFFTEDASGKPVLSWVREDSTDDVASVYYAVFFDSSKTFGEPHAIPTSTGVEPHGENMPKVIFKKDGSMMAVFNIKNPHPGNPYTGAVYYTQSFDQGKSWQPAQPLIKDTTESFDQRYFDMALLPDGEIGIVWLNDSRPKGSTLYFARTEGKKGFSAGKVIGRHACQCCRTDLLVDNAGDIHVAWRDILQDSIRDMEYCYSNDNGKTFSDPVRISSDNWVVDGCPHTGPSMVKNAEGLHFAWFTMGGSGGVYYCHTNDEGKSFSNRNVVSDVSSARHPQITALPDNGLALVWDEGIKYGKAIHQRVGIQRRGPNGLLLDTRYLTPDSVNATFPQIRILNDRSALVAYTKENGDKQQVRYELIALQP